MRRFLITLLYFTFLLNHTLFAKANIPIKGIKSVVELYSKTIGCLIDIDDKNIVEFKIDNTNGYVVLFGIDPECSRGSGMYHSALAFFIKDAKGNIFIKPSKSFPVADNNLPQHTTAIYLKEGKLRYRAKEYNWKKDALCCPSLNVEGKLSFKKNKWVAEPILKKKKGKTK